MTCLSNIRSEIQTTPSIEEPRMTPSTRRSASATWADQNHKATAFVLSISVLLFFMFEGMSWSKNHLWVDEYASLYFTDPTMSLSNLLLSRILPDTNPPLYQGLLAVWREAIPSMDWARLSFLGLNVLLICATGIFCVADGRRHGLLQTSLASISLVLLSGPILYYAPEGRAYCAGMCMAVAAAWVACRVLQTGASRSAMFSLTLIGVIAAGMHLFAAIFVASLAAGLMFEGIVSQRTSLVSLGFWTGLVVALVTTIWLVSVAGSTGRVSWIAMSKGSILEAFWYVRTIAIGPYWILTSAILFLIGVWACLGEARPLLRVFGVTVFLFALVPLLASFVIPMVVGRYWSIGAPALVVPAVFLLRLCLGAAGRQPAWHSRFVALGVVGTLVLLASDGFGAERALMLFGQKPSWDGAELVREQAADCPDHTIRVYGTTAYYALAARMPQAKFDDALSGQVDVSSMPVPACKIIGWAEHVRQGDRFMRDAPDSDLLALLGVKATSGTGILRHASGFVVTQSP